MSIELKSPKEAHYTVYRLMDPEGKVYIGCTGRTVKARWRKGNGYREQKPMWECILRYGWENIRKDILCEKLTKAGGEKLEKWFVEYYDSTNPEKGYNNYSGGSRKGAVLNEASRERLSQGKVLLCLTNDEYNRENRQRNRQFFLDHPERRVIIAEQMRAYLLSPEGRAFPECCKKAKPVRCVETGKIYPSARAAERETGLCSIHKVCEGRRKVSGGCHWEYVNEEDGINRGKAA